MTDLAQRPGRTDQTHHNGSAPRVESAATERYGVRPSARRRNRIVAGVVLAALAVAGNIWIYASLGTTSPVLQVTRDVLAGEQITPDMIRTVEVDADPSVNVIPAEQLSAIVGSHAKVRLVSGSLITEASIQPDSLVTPGASIVAVRVPDGSLPIGLRERVPVDIVIPSATTSDPTVNTTVVVPGRVIGLPSAPASTVGLLSLSVEVGAADAALVAAADDVRIVLLEPDADPALQGGD